MRNNLPFLFGYIRGVVGLGPGFKYRTTPIYIGNIIWGYEVLPYDINSIISVDILLIWAILTAHIDDIDTRNYWAM